MVLLKSHVNSGSSFGVQSKAKAQTNWAMTVVLIVWNYILNSLFNMVYFIYLVKAELNLFVYVFSILVFKLAA